MEQKIAAAVFWLVVPQKANKQLFTCWLVLPLQGNYCQV